MIPGNFHIQGNAYDVSAVKKGALDGMRPSEEKIAAWESFYKEKSTERPYAIKVGMKADDASVAYKAVLKHAGASERRDAVDRRIIREVRKGKAANKGSVTGLPGIIDSVNDVVND